MFCVFSQRTDVNFVYRVFINTVKDILILSQDIAYTIIDVELIACKPKSRDYLHNPLFGGDYLKKRCVDGSLSMGHMYKDLDILGYGEKKI